MAFKVTKYWQKGLRISLIVFAICIFVAFVSYLFFDYKGLCYGEVHGYYGSCSRINYAAGFFHPVILGIAGYLFLFLTFSLTFIGLLMDIFKPKHGNQ